MTNIQQDIQVLRKKVAQDVLYKYFGKDGDRLRGAVSVLLKQSPPTEQDVRMVDAASRVVLDTVVYWPLDPYLSDLSISFSRVLRAWAMRYQLAFLRTRADAIERIVLQHLTIMDAIAVLRKVLRRFEPLATYVPPSFRLARHYLETILAKYQSGEPINEYEAAGKAGCPKPQDKRKESNRGK